MIHIMQFLLQTQPILNNMICDLTLWFNHIMAQTKITNFRIWKFHKIIMMMKKSKYHNLARKLNEIKRLIYFMTLCIKNSCTLIHQFVYFW
jgi:hypothetical protein